MTPFAWVAAHPVLSLALILAAGFTAGYLAVGPAFFRAGSRFPHRPGCWLLSVLIGTGTRPALTRGDHRHHRGRPDPRAPGPGAPDGPSACVTVVEPVAVLVVVLLYSWPRRWPRCPQAPRRRRARA